VIEFRPTRAHRASPTAPFYRCLRCGADLWQILADGRVRCGDCEQECPFRTVAPGGHDCEANKGE